jgi:hypothetical protein
MARLNRYTAALAGFALFGLVHTASAQTVTESFSFNAPASSFVPGNPSGSLPGGGLFSWSGSFTITLNLNPAAADQYGTLSSFSSNLPNTYATPFDFNYAPSTGLLSIGDNCPVNGQSLDCYVEPNPTPPPSYIPNSALISLYLGTNGLPTSLTELQYTSSDGSIQYESTITAAVPEPGSLLLMASALGGLAFLRRRRV